MRILILLAALWIAGCTQEASINARQVAAIEERSLPDLSLVRDAYALDVTQRTGFYGTAGFEQTVLDTDRFGTPGDAADLGCLEAGIAASLPTARFMPAAEFWRTVAAGRTEVTLAELAEAPLRDRLRGAGVEVLVAGFNRRVPVSAKGLEVVIEGAYEKVERDVAAALVLDQADWRMLAAVEANVRRESTFAHYLFVIPVFLITRVEGDTCATVGERAAAAILAATPAKAPLVAVIAAGSNPYDAVRTGPRAAPPPPAPES